MNMLVAVDPSPQSREVIQFVKSVEWPKKTKIYLLHVIEMKNAPPLMPSGGPFSWHKEISQARTKMITAARRFLEKTKKEIRKQSPYPIQFDVVEGLPGAEILQVVKDYQVDLVILGTRGLSTVKRFLLGSTSDWVMRDAPCSVLLVRGKLSKLIMGKTAANILLATDGSSEALPMVRILNLLTFQTPPKVGVMHVVGRPAYLEGWYWGKGKAEFKQLAKQLMGKAKSEGGRHLNDMSQAVKELNMDVNTILSQGDPADEVVNTAERLKAKLIIVGSKGFAGGKPIPLGGVVRKIARYAPCSVWITRPGRPE